MKVLITGVSGFLGANIVRYFADQSIEVIGLVRTSSNLFRYKIPLKPNIKFYNVDQVSTDLVFSENTFDAVIHLATDYGRTSSTAAVIQANLVFPIQLLELAVKHKVRTFINTESYFNKTDHYLNSSLPNYSLSKKSFQFWLKQFSSQIQIANVYLEHMYGPFDSNHKFIEHLIQTIAILKAPKIELTQANQRRDFIHVSDVVAAYLKILLYCNTSDFKYKDFEIGTGASTTLQEFIELAIKLSKSNTKPIYGALHQRENEIMDSYANLQAISELGWKSTITPPMGIKTILESYGLSVI